MKTFEQYINEMHGLATIDKLNREEIAKRQKDKNDKDVLKCNGCGARNPETAAKCKYCGEPQPSGR
jgi:ribosomal protein L40E